MKPSTETWVMVAETDYLMAKRTAGPPVPLREGICYHAQQCCEKYLKAILEEAGQPIPKIHDLLILHGLVVAFVPALAPLAADLALVTPLGSAYRYPDIQDLANDLFDDSESAEETMDQPRAIVRAWLRL